MILGVRGGSIAQMLSCVCNVHWCFQSSESVVCEMSDEDPFSYTPLRVSKRKKRMAEGRQKKMRKGEKSEEVDIKEEIKEGIIEVFAGSKRRQLVDEIPSGD